MFTKHMSLKPLTQRQKELMPYFEHVFILLIAFCDECGENLDCSSNVKDYNDEYWFEYARDMKNAGWVIPDLENAYCADCAKTKKIKHNPSAYTLTEI